jgi:hypothetical protein
LGACPELQTIPLFNPLGLILSLTRSLGARHHHPSPHRHAAGRSRQVGGKEEREIVRTKLNFDLLGTLGLASLAQQVLVNPFAILNEEIESSSFLSKAQKS